MNELAAATRGRSMADDEQRDFDAASNEVTSLDEQITAAEAEAAKGSGKATIGRADAAEIATLCANGGVPMMTATLLAEGVTVDEAKTRVAAAGEAQNLLALARRKDASIPEDLATKMLAEGKGVEDIRTALFDKLVAKEAETVIHSHVSADPGAKAGGDRVVENMKRQIEARGLTPKEA